MALREPGGYSVILGVFRNAGYDQTVTLAQVFWMKEPQDQPARFHVAAERAFSIAGDFTQFGSDIAGLRKRLRSAGAEVFDNFPPYGAWFRRRFGIDNEQALDLFHQTVSMKSVGNLTDFVRGHMLEPFDVAQRIQALIAHFDDLNRAHEAVVKAKRQVEQLTPLVADCDRHAELTVQSEELRACRDALKPYFAKQKLALLDKRLSTLNEDLARHNAQVARLEEQKQVQQAEERELRRSIAENGGDRIERLAEDIRRAEEERARRRQKAERHGQWVRDLGLLPPDSDEAFLV